MLRVSLLEVKLPLPDDLETCHLHRAISHLAFLHSTF